MMLKDHLNLKTLPIEFKLSCWKIFQKHEREIYVSTIGKSYIGGKQYSLLGYR